LLPRSKKETRLKKLRISILQSEPEVRNVVVAGNVVVSKNDRMQLMQKYGTAIFHGTSDDVTK